MEMILLAGGCYTICGLADKYAVAKAKLSGTAFTFIMAFATVFFMSFILPFVEPTYTFSWQSLIFIVLIAACKLLEFVMASKVLVEMSAFELKAWMGVVLFASYFCDYFMYGGSFSLLGILFILITGCGLFLIAKGNKQVHYKKIIVYLIIYLGTKLAYGFTMNYGSVYTSSNMILYFALVLLSVVLFPKAHVIKICTDNTKGVLVTAITKLPNAIGLFAENAALAASMTGYSLIQPIILIALFFIGLIRRERCTKLNLAGSLISIVGIICFELLK